jgi:hypothetical protein
MREAVHRGKDKSGGGGDRNIDDDAPQTFTGIADKEAGTYRQTSRYEGNLNEH